MPQLTMMFLKWPGSHRPLSLTTTLVAVCNLQVSLLGRSPVPSLGLVKALAAARCFENFCLAPHHRNQSDLILLQECIPVGCIPAEHWPYSGVCCSWGGVPACSVGGCLVWGVYLPGPGGCTCLVWWGVPAWSRGGVPAWLGGMGAWSGTPPPCGQNDTRLWKYYLGQNFVSAGKYQGNLFCLSM